MGGFSAQVQQPQTDQPNQSMGKGNGQPDYAPAQQQTPQPMGKGGVQTNSATSGQPRAGMPNQYSNTVGQWDNAQIQPQQPHGGGKGKGQ
jgi:hypothetical protein